MDVVLITVSEKEIDRYKNAKTYPHELKNIRYDVPVFEVYIQKKNTKPFTPPESYYPKCKADYTWETLRFMPFCEKGSDKVSFIAGLFWLPVTKVDSYERDFYGGGIHLPINPKILKDYNLIDAFYIHKGPIDLLSSVFGASGCIEIVGDYNNFLENILWLLGFKINGDKRFMHNAMEEAIRNRKIWVEVLFADPKTKNIRIMK